MELRLGLFKAVKRALKMSRRIKMEGKMEQGIWKPYIQKSTKFVQKLVKYLKNLF